MPYKTDKLAIRCPFLDKRVKLLPCQKEMVFHWYKNGMSINRLSKLFNVSKRTIQFTLFPERKEKNIADREARGGSKIYYVKENHTRSIRKHRRYKNEILKNVEK